MVISTFQNLYHFFSSASLQQANDLYFKKMIELQRSLHGSDKSTKDLISMYSSYSQPALAIQYFFASKGYLESPNISKASPDEADRLIKEYEAESGILSEYAMESLSYPNLYAYIDFCEHMNNSISKAIDDKFTDEVINRLLNEFESHLHSYAAETNHRFENLFYGNETRSTIRNAMKPYVWNADITDGYFLKDGTEIDESEFQHIQRLLSYGEDERLPEVVIKFMLNPVIGTLGIFLSQPTHAPIYCSVFPTTYLLNNAEDMWTRRLQRMDPIPNDPYSYPDILQTKCQRDFVRTLRTKSLKKAQVDKVQRHAAPDSDDEFYDAQQGFDESSESELSKGKNAHGGNPAAAATGPGQAAIPDDSTYEPDPYMANMVLEYTEMVRNQKPTDLSHDHMTRFNTTSETPTAVSRWQLREGTPDFDFTIEKHERGVKTRFAVTYTRKSKKPIFNVIY